MKRLFIAAFLSLLLLPASAQAQQKIRFMIHWTAQAQFAGYYVAKEKGFFKDEGLDVELMHVSKTSTRSAINHMLYGDADICTSLFISALTERSNGNKIVNILQLSQNSGLVCVSHSPIKSMADLDGKRVGRWKSGFFEIAEMFCKDYSVNPIWVPYINSINLYVAGAVDAILCYSYSEYLNLLFATGSVPAENTIRFSEMGYNIPEDALFTTESFYNSNPSAVYKFTNAVKKGWDYVRENRDEAVDIVMKYAGENDVATTRIFQKMMLDEVLNLQVDKSSGVADYKKIDEETFNLLNDALFDLDYLINPVTYKEFVK